jgi:hypothetical protein
MGEPFAPALFQAILIGMAIRMIGRHSKFSKGDYRLDSRDSQKNDDDRELNLWTIRISVLWKREFLDGLLASSR